MDETTARYALPLIQPGQAQKEAPHNEALALLDLLAHPVAVAVGANVPPVTPTAGQCWIVGSAPTGAWAGHAEALAGWTGGGWRFVTPRPGMVVWVGGTSGFARWDGAGWIGGALSGTTLTLAGQQVVGARRGAIADPAGGAVIDVEARATLAAILAALRGHGLVSA